MATIQLNDKKPKRITKKKDLLLRGSRLNYNASQQAKYQRALLSLIRQMTNETKDELIKLFKGDTAEEFISQQAQAAALDESITTKAKKVMSKLAERFSRLFSLKSKQLASNMVDGASDTSKANLHSSLMQLTNGLSLRTGVVPKGMNEIASAIVAENVSLIKTIPSQYFKDVTGSVMRSITNGEGLKTLLPQIKKYDGQTERHAKNLALDQTRKAYNSINKQRMQSLGIKKFEWIHSGGGQKPRRSHIALGGNIFSFDNLPIINKEQVDRGYESPVIGIPGQAINCRCTMTPVLDFENT